MFPSNQNININDDDEFNRDFDLSDEIFPKDDVPMFVQPEYSSMNNYDDMMQQVAHNYNAFAHDQYIDQNQYHQTNSTTSSSVVLDFKNPTGAGAGAGDGAGAGSSWTNQPELELPAAAAAAVGAIKKLSHKEIERQRRQEMAKLHSSLRELLPLQFIKGKRSVAEHMSEAVNYIGHLQNRIKELGNKKDKMIIKLQQQQQQSSNSSSSNVVNISVNPCHSGVQVLISCDDHDDVLLSKVMEALIEEGHDIISSVSNLVNHKLLHNIKTQVNDPSEIDLFMLQQKLSYVINTN